jgi:hypothetical protein
LTNEVTTRAAAGAAEIRRLPQVGQGGREPVDLDPAVVEPVVPRTVLAAVLGRRWQRVQGFGWTVGAQQRIGQFEQRTSPSAGDTMPHLGQRSRMSSSFTGLALGERVFVLVKIANDSFR